MRIEEIRKWGRDELLRSGIHLAQLEADLLLGHVLGESREYLLAHGELPMESEKGEAFRFLLTKRINHEPVAYLLGKKEFFGIEFQVSPQVLIPRPETEMLVEEALCVFQQLAETEKILLVDVGTGSGAILLSILYTVVSKETREAPWQVRAIGTDVSREALEVANKNAAALCLHPRVSLVEGSLLGGIGTKELHDGTFAIIVANLPYISEDETLPPDVFHYEPHRALFGGKHGDEIILRFIDELDRFRPCGRGCAILEIGASQGDSLLSAVSKIPGFCGELFPDLQGIPRMLRVNYREICS